jgi:hypothetical protein
MFLLCEGSRRERKVHLNLFEFEIGQKIVPQIYLQVSVPLNLTNCHSEFELGIWPRSRPSMFLQ